MNVHGHLRGAAGPTRRHRNLSVERTGYGPVRLEEVLNDAAGESAWYVAGGPSARTTPREQESRRAVRPGLSSCLR